MPKISETFCVAQPIDRVWAFFQDIPAVVTCLPGLELTGQPEPGTYRGRLKVKLGAITAGFEGEATILTVDAAAFTTRIEGKGVDKKGGSRAQAGFVYRLTPEAEGTAVVVDADINLSGPLAQFGRTGILNDVAREMTAQFAANLSAKLGAQPSAAPQAEAAPAFSSAFAPAPALSGGRLLWILIVGRVRALFGALRRSRGGNGV